MNSFFDSIEKYKYGLMAVTGAYVLIFMYLIMSSYKQPVYYEPFHDGSYVEIPPEEIELTADNIEVPAEYGGDVTNAIRNAEDTRDRSYENFSSSKTQAQVEAEYRKLEEQMYQDAGGDKTREQIKQEMADRKNHDLALATQNANNTPQNTGGDNAAAGTVLVEFKVSGRDAHNHNADEFVRAPGYMCGRGANGVVFVNIKLNVNGNVTSATYNSAKSINANSCMIDEALRYAKNSRFTYSSNTAQTTGWIKYTFVSQ